jgi:hypothetical protein
MRSQSENPQPTNLTTMTPKTKVRKNLDTTAEIVVSGFGDVKERLGAGGDRSGSDGLPGVFSVNYSFRS